MEQINAGILKLMTFAAGSHVNMSRNEFGTKREEPTFDALLEKKSEEARSEVVNEKNRPEDPSEKETETEVETEEVKTEKAPAAEKDKEEVQNCDIAREVASAQIVWLMGQNNQDLLVTRQEDVAVIEQPLIIAINDEPVTQPGELNLPPMMQEIQSAATEVQTEEFVETEFEFAPDTEPTVEVTPEIAQSEVKTEIGGEEAPKAEVEIRVTGNDTEETGGEAVAEMPLFEKVEAAPIKVAEAPERTQESAPVERQVTEKLTAALDAGETRVEIQLEPLELGKLTIELTRSENGVLNILINAENTQTRTLLEKHIGNLQEALFERGQQSVQITVERNEESQRQENQQRNDFQDGSNGRQQEQQRRENRSGGEDFLQQLRLGLIPIEDEDED